MPPNIPLDGIRMTILGISSDLHVWNDTEQKFVENGIDEGKLVYLHIDGKDEVVSNR